MPCRTNNPAHLPTPPPHPTTNHNYPTPSCPAPPIDYSATPGGSYIYEPATQASPRSSSPPLRPLLTFSIWTGQVLSRIQHSSLIHDEACQYLRGLMAHERAVPWAQQQAVLFEAQQNYNRRLEEAQRCNAYCQWWIKRDCIELYEKHSEGHFGIVRLQSILRRTLPPSAPCPSLS
ncbi:hypothetical protein JCM11641_005851 [Rhodosporidiobolus odoratus]